MLYTNEKKGGRVLKSRFAQMVSKAKNVRIATAYFGASLVIELQKELVRVAKLGECKLLLGMVFHSGLNKNQLDAITSLDNKLRELGPNSGVYISRLEYHGKVYEVDDAIFLGSSNFSELGFRARRESTVELVDNKTREEVRMFLDSLFNLDSTEELSKVSLGKRRGLARSPRPSKLLKDYKKGPPSSLTPDCSMDIKLRVDAQPRSSLNLFFDKGRRGPAGKYAPRPWYEVEITANKEDRENPCYPKSKLRKQGGNSRIGRFNAYLRDGDEYYYIEMKVASDFGKALMSSKRSGGRATLGKYIKGKLERKGLLREGERITSETLEAYGRDYVTLSRIAKDTYLVEF